MPISNYYKNLRHKVGTDLIFMPSVAAIIRNDNNEILFQYPIEGEHWSLPAGAIEQGETQTPAQALIREVWEETGLVVKPNKLLGVLSGEGFRFTYPNGDQVEYNVCVFECIKIEGILKSIDGESADLRYFKNETKPELILPYPEYIFENATAENNYFQWREEWIKDALKLYFQTVK